MSLHARNVAAAAGAAGDEIEAVVERLKTGGHVRLDKAEAILAELRAETA
jgi:hydroxymethylglutaryl-CoA reductase